MRHRPRSDRTIPMDDGQGFDIPVRLQEWDTRLIPCQATLESGQPCPCIVPLWMGYPYFCGWHLMGHPLEEGQPLPRFEAVSAGPVRRMTWQLPINDDLAVYHFCVPPDICDDAASVCAFDPERTERLLNRQRHPDMVPLSPFKPGTLPRWPQIRRVARPWPESRTQEPTPHV